MTDYRSRVPLPPHRRDDLVRQVCRVLIATAPVAWQEIHAWFTTTVGLSTSRLEFVLPGGSRTVPDGIPPAAETRLDDLRNGMYRDRIGTWYSARIVIVAPGQFSIDYDYDSEPVFDPPLDASGLALDFEYFPRAREHTPEWLRRTLSHAGQAL